MSDLNDSICCILACVRILSEFNADHCADAEDREIPETINNAFVRGGLLSAIHLAAEYINQHEAIEKARQRL